MVDSLASATYTVEEGDTLISIAKKFKLLAKKISSRLIILKMLLLFVQVKYLKLPLPYCFSSTRSKDREKKIVQGLG